MGLTSRVYDSSPVWFQNAALSAYGLVLRSRRYGGIYSHTFDQLETQQWLPAEELETLQLQLLNDTLAAARKVAHYRERGLPDGPLTRLDQLALLPTIGKSDLRQARERLISIDPAQPTLEIHTGGTTGTPLSIYCDRAALQRNYAFFERFRKSAGYTRGDRVATFAGRAIIPSSQSRPPFWRRNLAANAMLFSSYHISHASLPHYVDALARFRPVLIDSYPSNLELLARYMLQNDIRTVRPKSIITSSETLLPQVRAAIEEAFGCTVLDHYGSAEMAALVTQCDRGTYHVNSDFGIVELLRDGKPVGPGEAGEMVVTGFVNSVMPLIRYRTGDTAIAGTGTCDCGRAFPALQRIEGRMDDFITTPEGYKIGRLDPIFKAIDSVIETRIVQDEADHLRLELVAGPTYMNSQGEILVEELRKRVGPSMRIDLALVPSIPRTAGGKLRMVVNQVSKSVAGSP